MHLRPLMDKADWIRDVDKGSEHFPLFNDLSNDIAAPLVTIQTPLPTSLLGAVSRNETISLWINVPSGIRDQNTFSLEKCSYTIDFRQVGYALPIGI
jgi:hypothetical protein